MTSRQSQRLKDNPAEATVEGKTAAQWKETHDQAVSNHQKALEGIKFQVVLDSAIAAAKGKSAKAITALLDLDALRSSVEYIKDRNFDTKDTVFLTMAGRFNIGIFAYEFELLQKMKSLLTQG